jgi:Fe-S cluster biosynthesis and repair protein YggX
LEETVPLEIITKRTLEKINATATSGGSVQDRARNIAKALWDVAGQRISGKINQEEWSSILRVVSEILNNQNNDLMSAIKRKYLEAGIHSLGSLSIFETFILDMLNPNEKEEILEKTNVIFEKMRNVVEALNIQKEQGGSDKKIGEEQKKIDALMDLLNQEDKVLSELKRLLGR